MNWLYLYKSVVQCIIIIIISLFLLLLPTNLPLAGQQLRKCLSAYLSMGPCFFSLFPPDILFHT